MTDTGTGAVGGFAGHRDAIRTICAYAGGSDRPENFAGADLLNEMGGQHA